jgi:hypothetical protein
VTWRLTIAASSSDAWRIRVPTSPSCPYNLAAYGNDRVDRESAKGLNEEIVTVLSPMLRAARARMVATHVLFGVPELSKLQEPGGSAQASRARD